MTESSSLNSYLWKLIPGFELRSFAGYTVCKPQTGWNTYFYLNTVLFICSDIGPVNFGFTTVCIPCLCPRVAAANLSGWGCMWCLVGGGQVALMTD